MNAKPTDTVGSVLEGTYNRYWKGRSNHEMRRYQEAQSVVEALGADTDIASLCAFDVSELVHKLQARGNANSTINRKLSCLAQMIQYAYDQGLIKQKPFIDRLAEPAPRLYYLSKEEENRILSYFDGAPTYRTLLVFLIDSGARIGEALSVTWKDVNFRTGMISLTTRKQKGGGYTLRGVPMTKRLRALLETMPGVAAEERKGLLWHGMTTRRARRAWDKMKAELGIGEPEYTLHICRHTFGSRLAQAGVSLQIIGDLMGHQNVKNTMIYAHLSPTNRIEAIDAMEALEQ